MTNFFDFSEVTVNSGFQGNTLEGNKIHNVTFEGCEAKDFNGKDGSLKKVLEIKFKNNEGAYTHTLWEPMGDDFNDTETPYRNPSRVKQTLALIKLLISAVNPTIMDKLSIKCSSWDELRKLVIDSTNPGKGTEVQIKLLKNNKGEGIFPMYFYSYNKEMEPYFSSYFIGKHLKFTDKELKRMEATPTVAPTGVSEAAPAEDTGLIFNL